MSFKCNEEGSFNRDMSAFVKSHADLPLSDAMKGVVTGSLMNSGGICNGFVDVQAHQNVNFIKQLFVGK